MQPLAGFGMLTVQIQEEVVTVPQHTTGEILVTLRREIFRDNWDMLAEDLVVYQLPLWFYQHLERSTDHAFTPKYDRIFTELFDLDPGMLSQLLVAPDPVAILDALKDRVFTEAHWRLRRMRLPWPDQDNVAQRLARTSPARYPYGGLLRCVRLTMPGTTVSDMSLILHLPELVYWQVELGQLPANGDVLDLLFRAYGTNDLRPLLAATDLPERVKAHADQLPELSFNFT